MHPPDADVLLTPAQQRALDALLAAQALGRSATLSAGPGLGTTTILRAMHDATGGALLDARALVEAAEGRHPLALEDALYRLLLDALERHRIVLVDDADLVVNVLCCGHMYPRQGYVEAVLTALLLHAEHTGRVLVLAGRQFSSQSLWFRAARATLTELEPVDYAQLCTTYLGAERAAPLDFARIHRFARRLSARQLRRACDALAERRVDTDGFVEHLRAQELVSNVDLGEVEAVSLTDLKGVDDVVRALEANVVLPLERPELATAYNLRAKRGVLLAGPPGTGKTTIGRALAHRLRSKFFLIDGTVIAGTAHFYQRVQQLFEAARQNAPSVVFIDDSDVIFEGNGDMGLYRYLLTMLDGLESESNAQVCLIMTAMDVGSIPPALVRSGRIELWLDMRLPDAAAREAILADRCAALPGEMGAVDLPRLAELTDGLSGADLRRLVDDGKLLFAFDVAHGRAPRSAIDYFADAAEVVRANRARYADAEARARLRQPQRPPYFDAGFSAAMGLMAQAEGPPGTVFYSMPGQMVSAMVVEDASP